LRDFQDSGRWSSKSTARPPEALRVRGSGCATIGGRPATEKGCAEGTPEKYGLEPVCSPDNHRSEKKREGIIAREHQRTGRKEGDRMSQRAGSVHTREWSQIVQKKTTKGGRAGMWGK